jgi:hypothetical protein
MDHRAAHTSLSRDLDVEGVPAVSVAATVMSVKERVGSEITSRSKLSRIAGEILTKCSCKAGIHSRSMNRCCKCCFLGSSVSARFSHHSRWISYRTAFAGRGLSALQARPAGVHSLVAIAEFSLSFVP